MAARKTRPDNAFWILLVCYVAECLCFSDCAVPVEPHTTRPQAAHQAGETLAPHHPAADPVLPLRDMLVGDGPGRPRARAARAELCGNQPVCRVHPDRRRVDGLHETRRFGRTCRKFDFHTGTAVKEVRVNTHAASHVYQYSWVRDTTTTPTTAGRRRCSPRSSSRGTFATIRASTGYSGASSHRRDRHYDFSQDFELPEFRERSGKCTRAKPRRYRELVLGLCINQVSRRIDSLVGCTLDSVSTTHWLICAQVLAESATPDGPCPAWLDSICQRRHGR